MRILVVGLLILMVGASALADPPASQPAGNVQVGLSANEQNVLKIGDPINGINYTTLLAQIKGGASMQQLAVMQNFARQKNAPAALPDLLKLLKQNDPQLDNNVSLAVTFILMEHPDADCPLGELLETVQRHQWTSQQKASQALAMALKPGNWKGREEDICRALIPLLTSQRSRVFQAALACLRKVSGQTMGPDADAWKAYFEKTFPGKELDLSKAVYEWMVVVKLAPDRKGYILEGEALADGKALDEKLRALAAEAKAKGLALEAAVQVSNDMMNRIARTNDFRPVQEAMGIVGRVTGSCTVSPEADIFRKPYRLIPATQPAAELKVRP